MAQERNTRRSSLPISGIQFLIVITLVIAVYAALDLSKQVVVGRRLGQWEKELTADVAGLEAEVQALRIQRDVVKTNSYVERVAREEFRWVKPGDVLVVPLYSEAPPQAVPRTAPSPESSPPVRENEANPLPWWRRLFSH